MIEKVKDEINDFINKINTSNYLEMYDKLFELICSYRNHVSKKELALFLYNKYYEEEEDCKEDVIGEVFGTLIGNRFELTDGRILDWDKDVNKDIINTILSSPNYEILQ